MANPPSDFRIVPQFDGGYSVERYMNDPISPLVFGKLWILQGLFKTKKLAEDEVKALKAKEAAKAMRETKRREFEEKNPPIYV